MPSSTRSRILEEGIALRAGDIDIVYAYGYGFPRRGGPMWYADTVGLAEVLDRIRRFEREHGQLWSPAPSSRATRRGGQDVRGVRSPAEQLRSN